MAEKRLRKPDPRRGKPGVMRRCLGPGREHLFRSPDPMAVRICNACKKKIYRQQQPLLPVTVGEDD